MFDTPYQTTPCSRFVMDKTHTGIRKLEIQGELVKAEGVTSDIKLVPPGADAFQPFQQPITKLDAPSLEASVVVDGRSLLRADRTPQKLDVYKHAMLNAQLIELWFTQGDTMKKDMLNLGDFPARVFVTWLSNVIVTRTGLDFGQAATVRALTALYYIQLFGPISEHPSDDEKSRFFTRAARVVPGMDANALAEYIVDIPVLNNIADYVKWLKDRLQTARIETLTGDTIYTLLGYNFGVQHREAVAVALEYPPTFLAMLYAACTERSFAQSALGKLVERLVKRQDDKEYVKNVNHLTGSR